MTPSDRRPGSKRPWRDICLLAIAALVVIGWIVLLLWASPRVGRAAIGLFS